MIEIIEDFIFELKRDARVIDLGQLARSLRFRFKKRQRFKQQPFGIKEFSLFAGKGKKFFVGINSGYNKEKRQRIRIYDYQYIGSLGKKTTTVLEVHNEHFNIPAFQIRPKGSLDKLKEFFVKEDKLFEYVPEFNTVYDFITPHDVKHAMEFNDEILDIIVKRKGVYMEATEDYFIFYYKHQVIKPKRIKRELQDVLEIAELLLNPLSFDLDDKKQA